jgi:hypothetical protein
VEADHGPFETEDEARMTPAVRGVYEAYRAGTGGLSGERMMLDACEAAGVELGAYDACILRWVAGFEPQTCAVFAGFIRRAYRAGLEDRGERVGYAIVTWPQVGGPADLEPGTGLIASFGDAATVRNGLRGETAAASRGERHEIAEVTEMEGEAGGS